MKLVLDSAVVIGGILRPASASGELLRLWLDRRIQVIQSPSLLAELLGTLLRPGFAGLGPPEKRRSIVLALAEMAEPVYPLREVKLIEDDPHDNRVLEAALAGEAEAIVTTDSHLIALGMFEDIPILQPAEALARYSQSSPAQEKTTSSHE